MSISDTREDIEAAVASKRNAVPKVSHPVTDVTSADEDTQFEPEVRKKHMTTPQYTHLIHNYQFQLRLCVFRRYLLNGRRDQGETWAQGISVSDLIFHNIHFQKSKFGALPSPPNVENCDMAQ